MSEATPENLRDYPFDYLTSRAIGDVLIGEDTAIEFINASAVGDVATLEGLLEQSPEIALESPHRIYQEKRPAADDNDVRIVQAMRISNLAQAISRAAENGHGAAVSTLLAFASRNGVKPSSVIEREAIKKTIERGHVAVFEVLAKAEPSVAAFDIIQGRRPLDFAIASNNVELAKVVLEQGGGREFPRAGRKFSYRTGRLCQAANSTKKDMTELMIQHGYTVKESGALQMAAGRGALDTIRMLVEEHGADVNEQLPSETLPVVDNALNASWTPMHFAARSKQGEAMKLLESYGAKTDVVDVNGKTPSQLFEEQKDASKK